MQHEYSEYLCGLGAGRETKYDFDSNLNLDIKGVNRDLRSVRRWKSYVEIVQETIEIATGHCVNRTISFFFFPEYSGVSRDYECEEAKLSFSLRVKILFSNQFYCIKYLPIHFSW